MELEDGAEAEGSGDSLQCVFNGAPKNLSQAALVSGVSNVRAGESDLRLLAGFCFLGLGFGDGLLLGTAGDLPAAFVFAMAPSAKASTRTRLPMYKLRADDELVIIQMHEHAHV